MRISAAEEPEHAHLSRRLGTVGAMHASPTARLPHVPVHDLNSGDGEIRLVGGKGLEPLTLSV